MKKQNLMAAVGTVALLANLLVPGLAFGQGTQVQQGTQVITCPEDGGTAEFSLSAPSAVTFDQITATSQDPWTFDVLVDGGADLPGANMLSVTDTRSGGADNCPLTLKGFTITAASTALSSTGVYATTIPNTSLFIRTSSDITGCSNAKNGVCYELATDLSGNTQDVAAALNLTGKTFNTSGSFLADLSTSRTLLSTTTSHNQTMKTGVALAVHVPANQNPGTYTGTVTYTLAKQ